MNCPVVQTEPERSIPIQRLTISDSDCYLCYLPMLTQTSSPQRLSRLKLLVVLGILAIALIRILPSYVTGLWPWQRLPELSHTQSLNALKQDGLTLPGWTTLNQRTLEIGAHKWSVQGIVPTAEAATPATAIPADVVYLLLRPQTWTRDMPQVEWMDINGERQWTTDSQQSLSSTVKDPATHRPLSITARFLRGWTTQGTYAVVQWYAWTNGGHPAPSRWFWADQQVQLRQRQRLPWVAVSLLIPIEPLGDIETVRPQAEALAQQVQTALITTVFDP